MAQFNKEAQEFADRWKGKGDEKQDCHRFWIDLLRNVFHVDSPEDFCEFEKRVYLGHTSFIDVYIPKTKVIIEQKSLGIDLLKEKEQSDGSMLSPYSQAKRYDNALGFDERSRWIIICNFEEFYIFDTKFTGQKNYQPIHLELRNLATEYYKLEEIVRFKDKIIEEHELSFKAGELVKKLYDALLNQYQDITDPNTLKSLNKLCVRLVFCFYAEDAGLFSQTEHSMFGNYLKSTSTRNLRTVLISLFNTLNTKIEERDPYLDEYLQKFPYVNGGLFAFGPAETEIIPQFTDEIKNIIVYECSDGLDWSRISPTIFGAVFESTLNAETRRSGGMHYTSIENIHKVIDPLFLDDLKAEFEKIKQFKQEKTLQQKLIEFKSKLASLTFLDPACGSGNFLTETYLSLRRLENEVILYMSKNMETLSVFDPIEVKLSNFYGIEIHDFAVSVAQTALWIAESQMMHETENIINQKLDFLPLKTNTNIVEGNALRLDWNEIILADKVNYIIGNPPFYGARMMNEDQKQDILTVSNNQKGVGDLDYVCGWYFKVAEYLKNNNTVRTAFVSTNSITQGLQPALLWKNLIKDQFVINFAYRTFIWDNEAKNKAHVHCVIIGFSKIKTIPILFSKEFGAKQVNSINPYLINGKSILIEKRKKPLSDVSPIGIGNQPIDDGNYIFTEEEKNAFLKIEPKAQPYFRPWYGADEFINNKKCFCLWLGDCSPTELRKMPECMKRIEAVKAFRLNSKRKATLKLAERPTRFQVENIPTDNYLLIPRISSERRVYIPIGFINANSLASDAVHIIQNASLYDFGVLTSIVHMAWTRVVAGRLKSDYRYSKDIVYNNFVWPKVTEQQKAKIEKTAQAILDARDLYPNCSLADLYDDLIMPVELRNAHKANDKAVKEAYGFDKDINESDIVAELFSLYARACEQIIK